MFGFTGIFFLVYCTNFFTDYRNNCWFIVKKLFVTVLHKNSRVYRKSFFWFTVQNFCGLLDKIFLRFTVQKTFYSTVQKMFGLLPKTFLDLLYNFLVYCTKHFLVYCKKTFRFTAIVLFVVMMIRHLLPYSYALRPPTFGGCCSLRDIRPCSVAQRAVE